MSKIRKKLFITIIICLPLFCGATESGRPLGLGIILGEPTGISAKAWLSPSTAVDAALAWSFGKDAALHIHADYLFHNYFVKDSNSGEVQLYYGIGAKIRFERDSRIGARIPLGFSYLFKNAPIDFFLEFVPGLDLLPATAFSLNIAIGVRYYF